MISAGDFRNGVTVEIDGNVCQIVEFQHVKPGKGAAFVRTKYKNIITGSVLEKSFRPTEKFPTARIERVDMQYLYSDGGLYYFMNVETFDQVGLTEEQVGDSLKFVKENVSLKNGTYAGGLAVKPEVLVQINGQTLVEGKDYELTFYTHTTAKVNGQEVYTYKEVSNRTEVTDGKVYDVRVKGIGGYATSDITINNAWGIDKKNINDCDVKVVDGVATVMNGYIPVPSTEYTVKENEDKTYTVTANATSKNYTGSKTVTAQGKAEGEKPDAPMISDVKVVGNKATVILSGESNGASGYDYVISKANDYSTERVDVTKNQIKTTGDFKYVQQGTYYAYLIFMKRYSVTIVMDSEPEEVVMMPFDRHWNT